MERTPATSRLQFTRRRFIQTAALSALPLPVVAQGRYPSRAVTIVVPFPAGGTTDLLARSFGQKMSQILGQPIVIENRGGGSGSIGAEAVTRASADGHTILFHNLTFSTTTVAMQLAGTSRHDIFRDFVPISLAANVPIVVVAPSNIDASDLRRFVELARAANGSFNYGSTGPGSIMNLVVEVLKRDTGIKIEHVPFRGAAPQMQAILGGQIQLGGDQLPTSLESIRAGQMRALATLAAERMPLLPAVPTVRELGFPNMELRGWNGFFAPVGTPREIISQLQRAVAEAASDPDIKSRLAQLGAETVGSDESSLLRVVREQVDAVTPIIRDLKLSIG